MAYQVIARKWRPQAFEDVTGQEPITRTLRGAIEHERLHHAYLFSGARGVGKTTTARLLAKALNCHRAEHPTPTPCAVTDPEACPSCREIAEGRSIDVLEIDAASNTGVDNVRETIINTVGVRPARDRFKVFIIDEVHMMSASAFNALLKTLEEPPPRVVFIMATTESHKLPDTILSRCQQFEFRTIAAAKIFERLRLIADAEKINVADDALREIARAGEGSMRDAQSAFDQVISFSGERIGVEDVETALGIASAEQRVRVMRAIAEERPADALAVVDDLVMRGHDLRNFCRDLLAHLRDLLVVKVAGDGTTLTDSSGDAERREMKRAAEAFSESDLVRFFHSLTETEKALRESAHPRYQLEIGLVKLIEMRRLAPLGQILERLAALEESLRTGRASGGNTGTATPPSTGGGSGVPPRRAGGSGGSKTSASATGSPFESSGAPVASADAPLATADASVASPARVAAASSPESRHPGAPQESATQREDEPPPEFDAGENENARASRASTTVVRDEATSAARAGAAPANENATLTSTSTARTGENPSPASTAPGDVNPTATHGDAGHATATREDGRQASAETGAPREGKTPARAGGLPRVPDFASLPKVPSIRRTTAKDDTAQTPAAKSSESLPTGKTSAPPASPASTLASSASSFAPPESASKTSAQPPATTPPTAATSQPAHGLKLVSFPSMDDESGADRAPFPVGDSDYPPYVYASSGGEDRAGAKVPASASASGRGASSSPASSASSGAAASPAVAKSSTSSALDSIKKSLDERRRPFLVVALEGARVVRLDGDELYVEYAPEGRHLRDNLAKPENVKILREVCRDVTGRDTGVRITVREAGDGGDGDEVAPPSKQDEELAERQRLREMAEKNPNVQHLLRTFRAEIIDVRRIEGES